MGIDLRFLQEHRSRRLSQDIKVLCIGVKLITGEDGDKLLFSSIYLTRESNYYAGRAGWRTQLYYQVLGSIVVEVQCEASLSLVSLLLNLLVTLSLSHIYFLDTRC